MLRLSLALLLVTTTASAAMPFDLPQVAVPAPKIPPQPDVTVGAKLLSQPLRLPSPTYDFFHNTVSELPVCEILGLTELFGSIPRYRTALNATRIEVARLSSVSSLDTGPIGYVESETVELLGWEHDILRRTLTADSSYIWDTELTERPECIPTFELRIRLTHGDTTITVELSFSSRMIRVLDGNTFISEQPLTPRGFARLLFLEPK